MAVVKVCKQVTQFYDITSHNILLTNSKHYNSTQTTQQHPFNGPFVWNYPSEPVPQR